MTRDARELRSAWTRFQRHDFPAPSPDLARIVQRYWVVSWTYREPYRQLVVPYPTVHLTFRNGGATVQGVSSGHQIKVLEGEGGVFGVEFRPGCFRPFLGRSVSTITDRSVDAASIFGSACRTRSTCRPSSASSGRTCPRLTRAPSRPPTSSR